MIHRSEYRADSCALAYVEALYNNNNKKWRKKWQRERERLGKSKEVPGRYSARNQHEHPTEPIDVERFYFASDTILDFLTRLFSLLQK